MFGDGLCGWLNLAVSHPRSLGREGIWCARARGQAGITHPSHHHHSEQPRILMPVMMMMMMVVMMCLASTEPIQGGRERKKERESGLLFEGTFMA